MKRLAFNVLTTPKKETGLSYLQSACIEGDEETVKSILRCSPDKLDSAIALSIKIGPNASHFGGKSILTALSQQDASKCKQISELIETILTQFQSRSLLHLAATKGQSVHLRRLLDCGECVNSTSPDGECKETPLMLAARFNEEDVLEFLVENGASLKIQDEDGFTPIHHAARGGKIRNVLRLIDFGADVIQGSYEGISAVHLAAENGHVDIIRLLLEQGANVNQVDREGVTPVMLAARGGHLEAIRFLFENRGDLNAHSFFDDAMPIHYAASGEHTSVVKFLLEKGSSVFAKAYEQESVLHLASSLELVSLLVEQGADIHARDIYEHTPLHYAAKKGQTDTVNYLLDHGADVNARASSGIAQTYPPLWSALKGGHAATAKILIERGTNFQYTEEENVSKFLNANLLSLAAEHGFLDVLQILLNNGLPVDGITDDAETALTAAARAGQCETVTFLLDRGANINGTTDSNYSHRDDSEIDDDNTDAYFVFHRSIDEDDDDNGCDNYLYPSGRARKGITPLYCALESERGEVAKLLIERGADTARPAGVSLSALELAARNSLFDIVELLAEKNRFEGNRDFDKFEGDQTLLISAASRGDLDSVMILLKKGVEVNAKNMSGDTALASVLLSTTRLHTAMEILKPLIAFGANINAKNDRRETPLLITAQANVEKAAELLLELGGDANVKNVDSYSPLHCAAQNNNGKLAEMLLQYGADPSVKTDQGEMTPLHVAGSSKSLHAAQVLLEHGVDLEDTDSLGRTPLAVAAAYGCSSIVESLIKKGSNVNATDKYGKTPLIIAVENLNWEDHEAIILVQTLLENGSSVNATDRHGRSALHYLHLPKHDTWRASPHSKREFCDLLFHYGACVTLQDENGETPLHFAASSGNTDGTEWLLQQGADVTAVDKENRTPLHAAAYGGYSIDLLIQNGADIHLTDNRGWLPLHLAVAKNWRMRPFDDGVAEILFQNGSDITAVDKKGRSLLHLSAKSGRIQLSEFLIRHGCNVNARDISGETVLGELNKHPCYNAENILRLYLANRGDQLAVDLHGRTVLHFAATHGCEPTLLDNLLQQGLNIETRDKNGETPLHRAAASGNATMTELFVARGADLSAVNHRGQTPLLLSFTASGIDCLEERGAIEVLLEYKSDVRVSDKNGNTALHLAISRPLRLLILIMENGGNVNAVNLHGCTPLHQAAYKGSSVNHARALLRGGASVHCQDKQGNTPLHIAIARGSDDIAEALIKERSDVNATNLQGRTCLHMASRFGSSRILEQVIQHGGQIDAVDELGSTPLHLAGLLRRNGWKTKVLLKHGSDPEAVDYKDSTPLHVACYSGNKEAAFALIDYGRYGLN